MPSLRGPRPRAVGHPPGEPRFKTVLSTAIVGVSLFLPATGGRAHVALPARDLHGDDAAAGAGGACPALGAPSARPERRGISRRRRVTLFPANSGAPLRVRAAATRAGRAMAPPLQFAVLRGNMSAARGHVHAEAP